MNHSTHITPVSGCQDCADTTDVKLVKQAIRPSLASLFKNAQEQGLVEPQREYATN